MISYIKLHVIIGFFDKMEKIKVFSKSREFLVRQGEIGTQDLRIISLVSWALDHRAQWELGHSEHQVEIGL